MCVCKSTAQHLENTQTQGSKLPLHVRYVKINAWMEDFTFMFPGGLINVSNKKINYENALFPSPIV